MKTTTTNPAIHPPAALSGVEVITEYKALVDGSRHATMEAAIAHQNGLLMLDSMVKVMRTAFGEKPGDEELTGIADVLITHRAKIEEVFALAPKVAAAAAPVSRRQSGPRKKRAAATPPVPEVPPADPVVTEGVPPAPAAPIPLSPGAALPPPGPASSPALVPDPVQAQLADLAGVSGGLEKPTGAYVPEFHEDPDDTGSSGGPPPPPPQP